MYARAGLAAGKVDHGVLYMPKANPYWGIAYVVDQFGLFVPPPQQHYFALGDLLIAGAAVLYRFDNAGHTVDFLAPGEKIAIVPRFLMSRNEIETEMAQGRLKRPTMRVGEEMTFWQWPEPPPPDLAAAMMEDHR